MCSGYDIYCDPHLTPATNDYVTKKKIRKKRRREMSVKWQGKQMQKQKTKKRGGEKEQEVNNDINTLVSKISSGKVTRVEFGRSVEC